MLHQDVGYPVAYPGGSLWLFGDTFYGRRSGAKGIVAGAVTNTVMHLSPDGEARYLTGRSGRVAAAIRYRPPETRAKNRLWPFSGVFADGRFYIFHSITEVGGGLGFTQLGGGLAESDGDDWRSLKRVKLKSGFPFKMPPVWLLRARDGTIYAYFVETRGFDSYLHIARTRARDLDDPASWTIVRRRALKGVFGQVSAAWNAYLDKYMLLYAGDVFKDPRTLWLRLADSPAGPFSKPVELFEKPGRVGKGFKGIFYCPYLHPELFRENGRIIALTYGVVGVDDGDPRLLEAELRKAP